VAVSETVQDGHIVATED